MKYTIGLNNKVVLLLTACVNPKGMSYTAINDVHIRLQQYLQAIEWYLKNTKFDIVVVENTGCDFSQFAQFSTFNDRLECLTFQGNNYDRNLGKGYGEVSILEHACKHSIKISRAEFVVKITGRVIVKNINEIIHRCDFIQRLYIDYYRTDLTKFAAVLFIMNKDYLLCFEKLKSRLNDSQGYYFEHCLKDTANLCGGARFVDMLPVSPIIEGYSGSLGKKYDNTTPFRWLVKKILWKIKYRKLIFHS